MSLVGEGVEQVSALFKSLCGQRRCFFFQSVEFVTGAVLKVGQLFRCGFLDVSDFVGCLIFDFSSLCLYLFSCRLGFGLCRVFGGFGRYFCSGGCNFRVCAGLFCSVSSVCVFEVSVFGLILKTPLCVKCCEIRV